MEPGCLKRSENVYKAGTNLFSYSSTANLGTRGHHVINRNTYIRLNAPSNVLSAEGQRVQLFGSPRRRAMPRVDIGHRRAAD